MRERKGSKNLILILFAFDYIFLYVLISRFAREKKRAGPITWTHLDDGRPGDCADALRADVEGAFQEADVAGHHETAGDGRVDVTAADVPESLPRERKVNLWVFRRWLSARVVTRRAWSGLVFNWKVSWVIKRFVFTAKMVFEKLFMIIVFSCFIYSYFCIFVKILWAKFSNIVYIFV